MNEYMSIRDENIAEAKQKQKIQSYDVNVPYIRNIDTFSMYTYNKC